jgi:thiosulfate/3-mercaptopyruvate sulfurtransferase
MGGMSPGWRIALKRSLYIAIVLSLFVTVTLGAAHASAPSTDMAVSTDWLASHGKDASEVVLHVGVDRKAYDAGHIPGARFLAMSEVTVTRNGVPNQVPAAGDLKKALEKVGVGDGSFVVAYGDGPLLATHIYFLLDYIGHDRHAILDGGLEKWKTEKRSVSAVAAEAKPATLTVKLHPELLLDLATVQKIVADKKTLVMDGRPADQFSGAVPGEGIKRGGHIPSAKNMFWMQALVSTANPVLKPAADIRALYEAAGVKTGKDVVAYCRTGLIAKHEYFTLKLARFRPLVYDGSFMEWSNASGTQVETGAGGF